MDKVSHVVIISLAFQFAPLLLSFLVIKTRVRKMGNYNNNAAYIFFRIGLLYFGYFIFEIICDIGIIILHINYLNLFDMAKIGVVILLFLMFHHILFNAKLVERIKQSFLVFVWGFFSFYAAQTIFEVGLMCLFR